MAADNETTRGAPSEAGTNEEGGATRIPPVLTEAQMQSLGDQIRGVMRRAMRDLIQEEVTQGEYGHVLKLWREVQERLLRLSGASGPEREKTLAAVDCDYAAELVEVNAFDNNILADMIASCSRRLADLGAVAYEQEIVRWGSELAEQMRGCVKSPAELLSHFFDEADVNLTRTEAGIAAHLLCQAFASARVGA